jgi:hypothetical protein
VKDRLQDFGDRHEFAYRRWVTNGVLLFGAGVLFGLGILAATAMNDRPNEVVRLQRIGAAGLLSTATGSETAEMVTETVRRKGKIVRLIRYRKGNRVVRTIPGLGTTIHGILTVANTRTVTTRVVNTTTAVQEVTVTAPPVIVTVFETVTCKPGDC